MYLMGDSDVENVAVAKERAKQEALRNASEQAAVFVESTSVVEMGTLTSDEIRTYTASVLRLVGTPQISMTPDGNGVLFRCYLQAVVDTDDFKDISVKSLGNSQRLAEENARLSREMDALREKYAKAQNEAEKQNLRSQIEQNHEHFMTVQDEEAAERFFVEGYNYEKKGNYAAALAAYQKAIHFNPCHSDAYCNLGIIYQNVLKDYTKAVDCFEKGIQANPLDADLYYNLGLYYEVIALNYDMAEKYFLKAIQVNPQHSMSYNDLGVIYHLRKNYAKAEGYYREAIKINPRNETANNNLGLVYRVLKDYTKAEECYRRAIQINPQNAGVYNDLANLYLNQGKYNDALKAVDKALSIDKKEIYQDTLGEIYLNMGQYQKALDAYSKAINMNRSFAHAYLYRGLTYEKMGDLTKALADIRKATELDPNDTEARQNYQRLQGRR
ncbi:tetratricopeptide repeat protein [Selenomonas ruminantium]|nr:tetratricopeptide repeat protein [Selenomonas ruminantium]